MTESQLLAKREQYETGHILHLLLSIITGGVWLPVWLIFALRNAGERARIDHKIRYMNRAAKVGVMGVEPESRPIGFTIDQTERWGSDD